MFFKKTFYVQTYGGPLDGNAHALYAPAPTHEIKTKQHALKQRTRHLYNHKHLAYYRLLSRFKVKQQAGSSTTSVIAPRRSNKRAAALKEKIYKTKDISILVYNIY